MLIVDFCYDDELIYNKKLMDYKDLNKINVMEQKFCFEIRLKSVPVYMCELQSHLSSALGWSPIQIL